MQYPELISVALDNGDTALFVNGTPIMTLDSSDPSPVTPDGVAKGLAAALGVTLHAFSIPVPSDTDWNWNDVYELLPPTPAIAAEVVPVRRWDSYPAEAGESGFTHEIGLSDQRRSEGQVYIDVAATGGSVDDLLPLTIEVSSSPLDDMTPVAACHVGFDGDNMAFSLFKIGDRILLRPEVGVRLARDAVRKEGYTEHFFWVDGK